jgi:multiple sugar transport system substrate-binding protein
MTSATFGTPPASASLSRRAALQSAAGLAVAAAVPGGAARAAAAKPDRLTMLYATSEADSDAIKAALPEFRKEFGFDIALDTMPYGALQQKAFAELASQSPYYDIMIVDTPWMPALTHKIQPITAMLLDPALGSAAELQLDDFIAKVFFDTAVFKPDASYMHWDGGDTVDAAEIRKRGFEIYGLPIQANVLTLAYRDDLFTARQVTPPQTWDELAAVAKTFTDPAKRLWGTTMMAGAGDWATDDFKTLLASFGGDGHLINDRFEPVFDSAEGRKALNWYVDLIASKVTPPGTTSASWDTVATSFGSGLAAMSLNYHTETLNPNVHGRIRYAMAPKAAQYGPHFGTWMLSVNSFSRNKEWALQAVRWFTSRDVQIKALATQLHPTRRSVYAAAAQDAELTAKLGNFYEVMGRSLEVGVGRPRLTNYSDIDRVIWIGVNDAARGAATPDAALRRAAGEVRTLLANAGYKP